MNLSFNLQAVGYSRSSLPRGTQYNTQTKLRQITIYTMCKKKQKHTLLHS